MNGGAGRRARLVRWAWRGQTDVISRLVKGVDMNALAAAAQADGKQQHVDELKATFVGIEYLIPFNAMTLQDAVDFAIFAIRTTIDTQRLTYGLLRSRAPGRASVGRSSSRP